MKKFIDKAKMLCGRFFNILAIHPSLLVFFLSYLIAFANEALSRRSVWEATLFTLKHPFMFLCNIAVIAIFEAIALLSRKKKFWLWFVSLFWLAMGITNFIVMFNRITPLSAMDIVLVRSIFPIIPIYLGWIGVIACLVLILSVIIALIIAWFRTAKVKINYGSASVRLLCVSVIAAMLIGGGFVSGAIPGHFSSLPIAYNDHGFTLCLSISVFDRGIDKPEDYEENIDDLVSDVIGTEDNNLPEPKETPNIIFVQLESFYDLSLLRDFSFSENPIPVFTELKNNFTSGILTVPSIGAGTANTEFEVLCGMALKYFGAGEYPYETILQKKTNESICFVLDKYGYSSHAVHNYKANFYARKNAYSKLGFDTFTSIEYMNGLEYNALGWAKDEVLLKYVIDSLDYTEGPDFIECVTVQGHGKYPASEYEGQEHDKIEVLTMPEGANYNSYKYFANQLKETDEFIGALISAVQARDEKTVIVFYSDHIPNIGFEEAWLSNGMSLFDTEYVIWRSDGIKTEDKNITSYQLYSEVLNMLDLEGGIMAKLHDKRNELSEAEYSYALHSLQYDILYGDCVAYGGVFPFEATDIKLGLTEITVTDVYYSGDSIYVKGTGFTESSRIFVNGGSKSTDFIDDSTLILSGIDLKEGDKIKIVQIADFIFHISTSETYVYTEDRAQ